jgi:hypothetical protein
MHKDSNLAFNCPANIPTLPFYFFNLISHPKRLNWVIETLSGDYSPEINQGIS